MADQEAVPQELQATVAAIRDEPTDASHWDRAEEIVDSTQSPDALAQLFIDVLDESMSSEQIEEIGERGVQFFETWYGDEESDLPRLLDRVMQLDPGAEWAFSRLTVALTEGERWDELLKAYDRAIEGADQTARRMQLLDEAAQAAKDFAGDPDRAIGYLHTLHALDPSNGALAGSLERLLERQGRWPDLISLWQSRLELSSVKQARELRARMAECYMTKLEAHDQALEHIRHILEQSPEAKPAFKLLEQLLVADGAAAEHRREAQGLLRAFFTKKKKPKDVVRVLEAGLDFADGDERRGLLRELVEKLVDLGDDAAAMKHQTALLVLEPMPGERDALRVLAERTRDFEPFAAALVQAAEACPQIETATELLMEAGRTRENQLDDTEGAIALYQRVFASEASADALLGAGRRLIRLLEATDREQETLEALTRLSDLEPEETARKSLLGRIARLAEKLGDTERARGAWQARIGEDTHDVEALDALIDVAAEGEDWPRLAQLLTARIEAPGAAERRREDMARLAAIHSQQLDDVDRAIELWRSIQETFGEDKETVGALSDLLARAERWKELAGVLQLAAEHQIERFTDLQTRLGAAFAERLGEPEQAAERYRSALQVDPENPAARAGLVGLLENEQARDIAIEALVEAYAQTDQWESTLELLEPRLAIEESSTARAELLIEAAELYEEQANAPEKALSCLARAFALIPDDRNTEREIRRLAERLDAWGPVVEAYRETIKSFERPTPRMAELRFDEGRTLEQRVQDPQAALAAYAEAASIVRDRVDFAEAATRVAAQLGRWEDASAQAVGCMAALAKVESPLVKVLEDVAGEADAWEVLANAMTTTLAFEADNLTSNLARDLHSRVARWHRSHRDDDGAAQASLMRAVHADDKDAPTLKALAELQRRTPDAALVDTLLKLADTDTEDIDPLYEAAQVIVGIDDRDGARPILKRLFDVAGGMLTGGREGSGNESPQAAAAFALEHLVRLRQEAGDPGGALELLIQGAQLPFEDEARHELRHRAAEIAASDLEDSLRAMALYRDLLQVDPTDRRAMAKLGQLFEEADRLPELLMLKRQELGLGGDEERKLQLRLDIVRILGEIESRGGALSSLMDNLKTRPGHAASLEALTALLIDQGKHAKLAQILVAQAKQLMGEDQGPRAGELLRTAAGYYENDLQDLDAAIRTYRELHELDPEGDASESLARLHRSRGQHAVAAKWLEHRLGTAPPETRAVTAVELAGAHLEAGQRERARTCLEDALREDPAIDEARRLLGDIYRSDEAWNELAGLLSEGAEREEDLERRLSYLRQASDLYFDVLGEPARAIDTLARAAELAPDDTSLALRLSDGYLSAGRHDDARAVLERMVKGFGRKRSPERGELHFRLAKVAEAAGDVSEAVGQLETATKMDKAHSPAMHALAAAYQGQGELEKAERTYRGLLMLVRRQHGDELSVGPSEIFFELSRIATAREQAEQAEELLESAMEAATQNDEEAGRFQDTLRARGETDLLMRVLDARLELVRDPELEASILATRAEVLIDPLGKSEEAMEALFRAVRLAPERDALHKRLCKLCAEAEELQRYLDLLTQLADEAARKRTKKGKRLSAKLTLRLGEAIEEELGDLDRAAGIYAKVEAGGEGVIDAWMAMARVAGRRGDVAEQRRVLQRIGELGPDETTDAQRRDALFGLAEIELASADSRADGVASMQRALAQGDADHARAKAVLSGAPEEALSDPEVLALFERVARESHDEPMLLSWYERSSALGAVTLDQLREGVDLAMAIGENDRAEALLGRCAELARALEGAARSEASWVFASLSQCRSRAGDVPGAIGHLREAIDYAEGMEAEALTRQLAALAAEGGNMEVAAEAYGRLLEEDRTDRSLWEPLLDIYRRLGDRARFEQFADRCLEDLLASEERAVVHFARARFLIDTVGDEREAVPALRALLEEEPGHLDATDLLTGIYQRNDMHDELAELLTVQFDRSRDERDVEAIAALGLRLGELYGERRREDAIDAYRAALEWAPEDRALLSALLERMGPDADARDRAETMHALLKSGEGPEAAEMALSLVDLWGELYESELAMEALARGRDACPEDDRLREKLEGLYAEREMWPELAQLLMSEAERLGAGGEAVGRLKNAASIYRDQMHDLEGAAAALRKALEMVPEDRSLLGELARNLAAAGKHEQAVEDVTGLLADQTEATSGRADLLKVRADLYLGIEDLDSAVSDLEEAYAIVPGEVSSQLVTALEMLKTRAFTTGEQELERTTALRLVTVLDASGDTDGARDALAQWVEQAPADVEALRLLRTRDEEAQRWGDVIGTCERLIEALEGDERAEAALGLAAACDAAGTPEAAREGLERVHEGDPAQPAVRARLRQLYETIGANRELATILMADAHAEEESERRVEMLQRATELYLQVEDPNAALTPLLEARELMPDDQHTQLLLVDLYTQTGRLEDAEAMLGEAIESHKRRRSPELAMLQQRMARVVASRGDGDGQLKWLAQALETDRKSGPIASELAEVAIEQNNYDAAMKALRSITMMEDPMPITRAMAFLKQAQIAFVRGDPRRAQHWARKAKSLDDTLEEADRFLAEIGAA